MLWQMSDSQTPRVPVGHHGEKARRRGPGGWRTDPRDGGGNTNRRFRTVTCVERERAGRKRVGRVMTPDPHPAWPGIDGEVA
ncbi:hypothetical protein GCM10010319_64910 [Streptomyces blastmyceticus]|uniref:Uncharacterized protein n=1 Tax=Streptomyces blastmyceticus TaxID=68180 RepID=A0ABP3HTR1_9ACTN